MNQFRCDRLKSTTDLVGWLVCRLRAWPLAEVCFAAVCLIAVCLVTPLAAQPPGEPVTPNTDWIRPAARDGRKFLTNVLDPALNLLPEFSGSNTYWLFHDNYLAEKVLTDSHPEIAARIRAARLALGGESSGKIEIVGGEASHPLPFRTYQLVEVKRIGDKVIKTEKVTDTVLADWQLYADLLFLAALAETDPALARPHFDAGAKLWNGIGFHDRVAAAANQYATYKLALCLLASQKLRQPSPVADAALQRMRLLQNDAGGWITDYDAEGHPRGQANVETTSLAILALDGAIGQAAAANRR